MTEKIEAGPSFSIVRSYFGFLEALGVYLRKGGDSGLGPSPLLDKLPGLDALFRTFPVASPTDRMVSARRIEDWNPLGQRLLLPNETPAPASEFETNFSLLTMAAQTLVEWAHEAIHILAVEPWCAGHRRFEDVSAFREWYLAAEGLAFWYADIVVTRTISAERTPGGTDLHPFSGLQCGVPSRGGVSAYRKARPRRVARSLPHGFPRTGSYDGHRRRSAACAVWRLATGLLSRQSRNPQFTMASTAAI